MRRLGLAVMLVAVTSACSGSDSGESRRKSDSKAQSKFDPTEATLEQKIDRYEELYERRGVDSRYGPLSRGELPTVAANLCDNPVADMEFYLDAGSVIDDAEEYAADGVTIIDAFCPDSRLQFEAAADRLNIDLPPPPKD